MPFLSKITLLALLSVSFLSFNYDADQSNSKKYGDPYKDGIIILEGKYQNRNIYVTNPAGGSGVGFCAFEVRVNGDVITDEVNGQAFEIDLSQFDLTTGEKVTIEIKHKGGCAPSVLNPGGLKPKPTFVTKDIDISKTGVLSWETKNEAGVLDFQIQQYKWNKWITVGQVTGIGTPDLNSYDFKTALTSGRNKFRVMQKNYEGKIKKSESVEIESNMPKMTYVYNSRTKEIVFSGDTQYEVIDAYGRILKRGYNSSVDVSSLSKGMYYLCFDNSTESFKR